MCIVVECVGGGRVQILPVARRSIWWMILLNHSTTTVAAMKKMMRCWDRQLQIKPV